MSNAEGKTFAGRLCCVIQKLLVSHRCSLMIHVKCMRDFSPASGRLEIFYFFFLRSHCHMQCCLLSSLLAIQGAEVCVGGLG